MEQKYPGKTPPRKALTREERLKDALKANMARRKAQARARAAQPSVAGDDSPDQDNDKT